MFVDIEENYTLLKIFCFSFEINTSKDDLTKTKSPGKSFVNFSYI